jgi:hypothetical protein
MPLQATHPVFHSKQNEKCFGFINTLSGLAEQTVNQYKLVF